MKNYILCLITILLVACSVSNTDKVEATPQQPLGQSVNSDTFNLQFSKVLNAYYALKDAFISEDLVKINEASTQLKVVNAINYLKEIKADTSIIQTAKVYATNLNDELTGLLKETDINNKRKSFQIITSDIYDIIRIVRYDREKVYMQHCPMAFKNNGADWLSNSSEILNPYLPKQMLDCGEIKDSVDYRN